MAIAFFHANRRVFLRGCCRRRCLRDPPVAVNRYLILLRLNYSPEISAHTVPNWQVYSHIIGRKIPNDTRGLIVRVVQTLLIGWV